MKIGLIVVLGCLAVNPAALLSQSHTYRDRWVYVSTDMGNDQELERVEGIARTASEHGLNGILLSAGFDDMDLKVPGEPRAPRAAEANLRPPRRGDHSRRLRRRLRRRSVGA